jgi:hypothetical protein
MVLLCMAIAMPVFSQNLILRTPKPIKNTALNVKWDSGAVANGGHVVGIAGTNVNVTASRSTCALPILDTSSCNIVYANSSGTVANTSTVATAIASGNTILALVETDSTTITRILYPSDFALNLPYVLQPVPIVTSAGAGINGATVQIVIGSGATTAGTLSITGLPFTSQTSYSCTGSTVNTTGTTSMGSVSINNTGATTATAKITGNSGTDAISWSCVGK